MPPTPDSPDSPGPPAAEDPAARLAAERTAVQQRLVQLEVDMRGFFEASRDSNADDEHDPEGQTIAFERAQLAAVTAQARRHLAEVEAAIARVEEGTYGLCEQCGEPIAPGRLEARPTARTCVRHA
ncbi:TraR/DksA family transcriptional regulator [Ornithinimicrobium flavum]|uniref:TraR/DksA family transcriptional regulator n=1 Tax=Ornithinimicrobium flavum TaxID=1288636 RepID=UPI001EE99A2F|nr:TraR/DksA C4-type zinc finger protein [Ornithinimicrobium flavum]